MTETKLTRRGDEEIADARLTRRGFLEVSGGIGLGLAVSLLVPACAGSSGPNGGPGRLAGGASALDGAAGHEVNAYVRVGPDGQITIAVPKSEMGQGVLTSLAMLVAEELEVDWSAIRSEHALADESRYGRWSTGGSRSVREGYEPYRRVGAAARLPGSCGRCRHCCWSWRRPG